MQHALAHDLYIHTSSTYDTPSQPYYRSMNANGFRVARATGEIFGEYVTGPMTIWLDVLKPGLARPQQAHHSPDHLITINPSNVIYVDFGKVTEPVEQAAPAPSQAAPAPSTVKRGPKPKVRDNPLAPIIRIASNERAHWIDDAVMAGMYIGVGSNNGKLNVSPRSVRMAMQLDRISVQAIVEHGGFLNHRDEPYSERSCQYVAAAGRIAVSSVEHYLHHRPTLKSRLEIALNERVIANAYEDQELDHLFSGYMQAA